MTEEQQPIQPIIPIQPPEEIDPLEIDTLTVNCTDIPDLAKKLTKKVEGLQTDIQKIHELQQDFPHRKALKRLENDVIRQKQTIETKIAEITERYSACNLNK